jgi:Uncharacterized protein conserved in bacteria (DUF2272)
VRRIAEREGHREAIRRQADVFFADLMGAEAIEPAGPPVTRWLRPGEWPPAADAREPFFDDAPDESWAVVVRPGAPIAAARLRAGDLIVHRGRRGGGPAWSARLVDDVDPRTLAGPDGVMRPHTLVLRRIGGRARSSQGELRAMPHARPAVFDGESYAEIAEACGFFGPSVRRSEAEVREAVVARAIAEWAGWHDLTGAPRREGQNAMFPRLVSYYLAGNASILPDTLTALQTNAFGPAIGYGPLLASGASPATIAAEERRIATLLLAGAPGGTLARLPDVVAAAIDQARQAHVGLETLPYSAWSAVTITACVRGAAIALGIEGVTAPRTHVGRDGLLTAAASHSVYTLAALERRRATPTVGGTYHAFGTDERAPQLGDIIVQDRQATTRGQVRTFATLGTMGRRKTHGDIVVEVQPTRVVTIGGNLGDSMRKRHYPRTAEGLLVVDPLQLFSQEDDAGAVPALPLATTQNLHSHSTGRIFAILSPVQDCAAIPGQPMGGGFLV